MSGLSSSSPSSPSATSISEKWWVDEKGTAHEECKVLFFAEGKYLGEGIIDPGSHPEMGYRRGGVAFFCSHCGEIWGRVGLVNSSGQLQAFEEVSKVSCSRHPYQWGVAGSLLEGYGNTGYLAVMPLAVLQREFLLHLREIGE